LEFRASQPRPPQFVVHLVSYPAPVLHVIPPSTVVIGGADEKVPEAMLREAFRRLTAV
jgi:hypothetical protein